MKDRGAKSSLFGNLTTKSNTSTHEPTPTVLIDLITLLVKRISSIYENVRKR